MSESEKYNQAVKFLCNEQEHKFNSFEVLTKYLTNESFKNFQNLIVELAIIKQKIVDLPCDNDRYMIDFEFNLSHVIGSREIYQKFDLKTGLFHPLVYSEK